MSDLQEPQIPESEAAQGAAAADAQSETLPRK